MTHKSKITPVTSRLRNDLLCRVGRYSVQSNPSLSPRPYFVTTRTDWRTDGQHDDTNNRSYYVAVRSAKNRVHPSDVIDQPPVFKKLITPVGQPLNAEGTGRRYRRTGGTGNFIVWLHGALKSKLASHKIFWHPIIPTWRSVLPKIYYKRLPVTTP